MGAKVGLAIYHVQYKYRLLPYFYLQIPLNINSAFAILRRTDSPVKIENLDCTSQVKAINQFVPFDCRKKSFLLSPSQILISRILQ